MYIYIWQFLTRCCGWVWRRASVSFILRLLVLSLVAVLVWSFDLFDGTFRLIVLTALVAVFPIFSLVGPGLTFAERLRVDWGFLGVALLFCAVLLIVVSDRFDWASFGLNVGVLLYSSPFLLVLLRLISRNLLLGVGVGLPIVMVMAAWVMFVLPREYVPSFLLFPLPAVLLLAVLWALCLYGVHSIAQRARQYRVWGPLTESLLMALMFFPVIVLAVLLHWGLDLSERWLTVFILLVGLLFSSVVSVPLRQFLLDLGNLPTNRRWEGTGDDGLC